MSDGPAAAFHFTAHQVDIVRRPDLETLVVDEQGVALGYRWSPVQSAGLYVPGGTASYPSSVLMNALPAKVAEVERVVMVVPAPDGKLNPLVLVAAALACVDPQTITPRVRDSDPSSPRQR